MIKAANLLASLGAKSSTVLALFILVAFYPVVFRTVQSAHPEDRLHDLGLPQWIITDTRNIPRFLESSEQPDVLVMGSSLILSPAYKINNRHTDFSLSFLEKQVAAMTGKQLKITNLGVAFAMVSDQYLLLKNAIDKGKAPKFVIYATAPRDFVDNTATEGNSPTAQILAVLDSNEEFFPKSLGVQDITAKLATHQSVFKTGIKHVRNAAEELGSAVILRNSANIDSAKPLHSRREVIANDMEMYKNRYNPPNYERLHEQVGYLNKLLLLCRSHDIPVLIVNMPITEMNRKLLDANLSSEYLKDLEVAALAFNCKFANVNSDQSYEAVPEYFDDTVHLSASGGKKFFSRLAQLLANDSDFATKFGVKTISLSGRLGSVHY